MFPSIKLTDADKKYFGRLLVWLILSPIILLFVGIFCPEKTTIGIWKWWVPVGNPFDWIKAAWPIFLWGMGFTFIASASTKNKLEDNLNAEENFKNNIQKSILAGVFEEILFRWLFFLAFIIYHKMVNWMTFGLIEWLYLNIVCHIANWLSLTLMSDYIFFEGDWAVGAALIMANGLFRDGHRYLGIVGIINSWVIGLFFFYLFFTHGLIACIVVHTLYDLGIFVIHYIDAVIERYKMDL